MKVSANQLREMILEIYEEERWKLLSERGLTTRKPTNFEEKMMNLLRRKYKVSSLDELTDEQRKEIMAALGAKQVA